MNIFQKNTILVVDDDRQIGELLAEYLGKQGYRVLIAHNGLEMKRQLEKAKVDLIVLDIMMPGEDGLALCRKLRTESAVMIIMLSASGDEMDRVLALELGADDYLAKPFNPRELLARIKALLRRASGVLAEERKASQLVSLPNLHFLAWTLDRNKRRLVAEDGVILPLSSAEYELLIAFIQNAGRVLNRDQLLDLTHGRAGGPLDRTIDVQVGRLRKKIEIDPKEPTIIVTVRGGGYQFMPTVSVENEA